MVNHPRRGRSDGPKLTKHKDPAGWRVYLGGKPTALVIFKGDPPRYREPQLYFLTTDDDDFILEAPGVGGIMARLEALRLALATPSHLERKSV